MPPSSGPGEPKECRTLRLRLEKSMDPVQTENDMRTDQRRKRDALRRLAEAAQPFGFRVEKTPFAELPDLVLLPPSDRLDVARLRYLGVVR